VKPVPILRAVGAILVDKIATLVAIMDAANASFAANEVVPMRTNLMLAGNVVIRPFQLKIKQKSCFSFA
jgi:hypothetical protein